MLTGQAIASGMMDFMSVSTASGNSNTKANAAGSKDSVSFDSLLTKQTNTDSSKELTQSIKDSGATRGQKQTYDQTKTFEQTKAADKSKTVDKSKTASNQSQAVKQKNTKPVKDSMDTTNVDDVKKPEDAVTKEAQTLLNAVEEVKETVMETLDVTEEQLVNMLESLGMTMLDLLNPDNLKQITLAAEGSNDVSLLLTDENLNQKLTDLLNKVSDILDKSEIIPEKLSELTPDNPVFEKVMEAVNTAEVKVPAEDVKVTKEDVKKEDVNQVKVEEPEEDTESNIAFSVVRETQSSETGTSTKQGHQNSSNEEMKTETPQAAQFIDHLANSAAVTQTEFEEHISVVEQVKEIANQIMEQIRVVIKPDMTALEFNLNPHNLGKVALNITAKNGVMTASFTTQTEMAREAIESQMQQLRESLENQGIKVDAIEVTVSNFSFGESSQMEHNSKNQGNTSAKGRQKPLRFGPDDTIAAEDGETAEAVNSGLDESSFDYTA